LGMDVHKCTNKPCGKTQGFNIKKQLSLPQAWLNEFHRSLAKPALN